MIPTWGRKKNVTPRVHLSKRWGKLTVKSRFRPWRLRETHETRSPSRARPRRCERILFLPLFQSLSFVGKCIFRPRRTLTTVLFQKQIYSVSAFSNSSSKSISKFRICVHTRARYRTIFFTLFFVRKSLSITANGDTIHAKQLRTILRISLLGINFWWIPNISLNTKTCQTVSCAAQKKELYWRYLYIYILYRDSIYTCSSFI